MYPSVSLWRTYSTCVVVLHVIFCLLLLCSAQVWVQEGNVTCAVPPVEPLASTSLKCYFPENITQTKRDFSVYWYKEDTVPENILDCWWWSEKMKCYVRPGYNFISILPDEVTLEIPRATVEHAGTYACILDTFNPNNSKTCEFGFKLVGKTMCDIRLVARKSQTSLTCYFPENISRTKTGFTVYHLTSRGDKNDVMDCGWKQNRVVCNTTRGYKFDYNVADHVTLKIPSPSENHEGTYSCQIKGDEVVRSEICSFMLLRETTSSCHIPSVYAGDPTTLTCRFSADVNVTKRNVQVVRVSGEGSKAVTILTCTWRNKQLDCAVAAGYEFSNTISDHLVIRIPQASRDHNGTYACYVLESELEGFKPCPFIVVTGKDANFVPVIIIAISSGVFLIILGIIAFYCLRKKVAKEVVIKNLHEDIPMMSMEKGRSSSPPVSLMEKLATYAKQLEEFWKKWVEAAFPDLDSSVYFLPPVRDNRVKESIASQEVWVLQPSRQTDQSRQAAEIPVQYNDAAMQRILLCLERMCKQKKEVLVGVSKLLFEDYQREPYYAPAEKQLPLPAIYPSDLQQKWKQGDVDVLLIHRQYGLVICKMKDFGGNVNKQNIPKEKIINYNLKEAIVQLDKAGATLSDLASDVAPGLRVTKTIAFPNLTVSQVQQVLVNDPELTQDLCRCLRTRDPADIARLCLCSDQLSDPKTPCDVSSHVLRKLRHWWQRRVAGAGHDSHMTPDVYKTLVARFCGPATTVSVPCTCPPRVSVKTLGQAVWCTGECYTAVITLFPEQLHLLHTAPPTLFVTGPPGTGKTVVLLLMGIQWLRCGHHVYIVSTWYGSLAVCTMLYHLLLQTVNTLQSSGFSPGQPHLLQYHLDDGNNVEKAVNDLSQAAREESLHVIADEVGPDLGSEYFGIACNKLLTQVPRLHLWAASCFHGYAPTGWQVEYLTRPLRSPQAVIREVEQDVRISKGHIKPYGDVQPYSERGVSDHTDGPPVTRLYHRGQGHSGDRPVDCVTCGREVASFLHSLRIGVQGHGTSTSMTAATTTTTSDCVKLSCLQWRDVLVLYWGEFKDSSALVIALKEAGIPVGLMKDDDIQDVATARRDVVWMTNGHHVRGLERKVVVCLYDPNVSLRLHTISRCTAQLVIVSPDG